MIVLDRKKLCLIIFLICLPLVLLLFTNKKSIEVSSTPISNHVIVLDAGHGNPDGGATGDNGSIESEINLDITLKLQSLLEATGATVILTRSDENGIYDSDAKTIRSQKVSDMKNRVKIASESKAEIFISIHMNKLPQKQYSGWQTFYKNNDETSKIIATSIQNSLNTFIEKENNRKVKSISGIYLTKNVEIPLVLVECGFLSNSSENELLQTDSYQERLAWCIYIGLMNYFD